MEVVAPTTDMSILVHKESPWPLIPKAQPTVGMMMNLNQDGLNNEGYKL